MSFYNGGGAAALNHFNSGKNNMPGPTDFVKQHYYQPTIAPYGLPNGSQGKGEGEPDTNHDFTDFFGPHAVQKGETRPQESFDTPDAYGGASYWQRSVWISIITSDEAYPLTEIAPWAPANGMSIHWNMWRFEDALPVRNPEEATNRVIRSNQTEGSAEMQRYGIGLQTEYGFWKTPMGRIHYALGQQQMKNAIVEGQCLGVIQEILNVPRVMDSANDKAKKRLTLNQYEQLIQEDVNFWGAVHKDRNGWDMVYDRMRQNLVDRGVHNSDYTVVPRGLAKYLEGRPENNNFWVNGVGKKSVSLNGQYGRVRESRAYRIGDGRLPYDPNFRQRSIGSYVLMNDELLKNVEDDKYKTSMRDIRFFSVNDDMWQPMSLQNAFLHSGLFDFRVHRNPGDDAALPNVNVGAGHSRKRAAVNPPRSTTENSYPLTALGEKYFDSYTDFFHLLETANCFTHLKKRLYHDENGGLNTQFKKIFGDVNLGDASGSGGGGSASRTLIDNALLQNPGRGSESKTSATSVSSVYKHALGVNEAPAMTDAYDKGRAYLKHNKLKLSHDIDMSTFASIRASLRTLSVLHRVKKWENLANAPVLYRAAAFLICDDPEVFMAHISKSTNNDDQAFHALANVLPFQVLRADFAQSFTTTAPITAVGPSGTPRDLKLSFTNVCAENDALTTMAETYSKGRPGDHPALATQEDATKLLVYLRDGMLEGLARDELVVSNFVTEFFAHQLIFEIAGNTATLKPALDQKTLPELIESAQDPALTNLYKQMKESAKRIYQQSNTNIKSAFSPASLPEGVRDVFALLHKGIFDEDRKGSPFGQNLEEWRVAMESVEKVLAKDYSNNEGNSVGGPSTRLTANDGGHYTVFKKELFPIVAQIVDATRLRVFNENMQPFYAGFVKNFLEFDERSGKLRSDLEEAKTLFALWIAVLNLPKVNKDDNNPEEISQRKAALLNFCRQVAFSQEGATALLTLKDAVLGNTEFSNRHAFNAAIAQHSSAIEDDLGTLRRDQQAQQLADMERAAQAMETTGRADEEKFGTALRELLQNTPIKDARQFIFFLTNDIRFPVGFILFRPHERYRMGTAVHMLPGSGTANTIFGNLDVMVGANVAQKMHLVNITFYAKNMVWENKNITRAENVLCTAYEGGAGKVLYEHSVRHRQMYAEGKAFADMFSVAVPLNWTPAQHYLDITGHVDPNIVNMMSKKNTTHYPSADLYAQYWGWSHPVSSDFNNFFDHLGATSSPRYNTVCLQGASINWHDGEKSWSLYSISQGHWGPNVYPGVGQVYKGLGKYIDKVNYTQLAVVGVVAA